MITRILAAAAEGETKNPLIPEPYDILWSSVVFVILLTFFWFKVLPNFKKTLDERAEAIEGRLEAAEKAQAEAAAKTANIEAEQAAARATLQQLCASFPGERLGEDARAADLIRLAWA